MKTAIFTKIGNEKIITGFSKCLIDMEATKRKALEAGDKIPPVVPGMPESQKAKRLALIQKHAVYFHPSPREKIVSNETWAELKEKHEKKKEHEVVALDGRVLADYRGKTDYRRNKAGKLEQYTIEELGIIPAKPELNEAESKEYAEQMEEERIAAMKKADRDAEKLAVIDSLADRAVVLRSKGEIQGKTAAVSLADATAWYNAEVAKVEAKYK